MKKIVLSLSILASVLFAETKVECQNTPVLVLNYEELMCPEDLEKISADQDVRIKRVVARYTNLNEATIFKLSKYADIELKKRLILNTSVKEDLKEKLKKEIEFLELKQKEKEEKLTANNKTK